MIAISQPVKAGPSHHCQEFMHQSFETPGPSHSGSSGAFTLIFIQVRPSEFPGPGGQRREHIDFGRPVHYLQRRLNAQQICQICLLYNQNLLIDTVGFTDNEKTSNNYYSSVSKE